MASNKGIKLGHESPGCCRFLGTWLTGRFVRFGCVEAVLVISYFVDAGPNWPRFFEDMFKHDPKNEPKLSEWYRYPEPKKMPRKLRVGRPVSFWNTYFPGRWLLVSSGWEWIMESSEP